MPYAKKDNVENVLEAKLVKFTRDDRKAKRETAN